MRRRASYPGWLGFLLLISLGGRDSWGQVPPRPLRDVQVRARVHLDEATGIYWYEYEVTNPASNELNIADVSIDITAPQGMNLCCWQTLPHQERFPHRNNVPWTLPNVSALPGEDWSAEAHAERDYQVRPVPVGPFAPPNWSFGAGGSSPTDLIERSFLISFATNGMRSYRPGSPIQPGMTMGGFRLTSYEPPGIRAIQFYVDEVELMEQGRVPEEWMEDEGTPPEVVEWINQQWASLGYKTETIGPMPLTVSGAALAVLLREYVDRSVGLGWITDAAYAEDLRVRLERIRGLLEGEAYGEAEVELLAFLERVDGAGEERQRPEAWGLLYYNGQELLEQVRTRIPLTAELVPSRVERMVGEEAEFTVTVMRGTRRVAGQRVQAWVGKGVHEGLRWEGVTDERGQFRFSYRGRLEGMDRVEVCYEFCEGELPQTISGYVIWSGGPDLAIGLLVPRVVRLPVPGDVLRVWEATVNIGILGGGESTTRYYLSVDETVDDMDRVLGERRVEPLAVRGWSESRQELPLPEDLAPGAYYVIACADAGEEVAEIEEGNNCEPLMAVLTPVVRMETPPNQPPDCSGAQASPGYLWPPNHQFWDLAITGVTDPDGDAVTIEAVSIRQDEPLNGLGDGDTSPDGTLAPLRVRAERAGTGNGRVYHVTFRATDGRGGTCEGTVTVCVPHDQGRGAQCVDDGLQYDSTQP